MPQILSDWKKVLLLIITKFNYHQSYYLISYVDWNDDSFLLVLTCHIFIFVPRRIAFASNLEELVVKEECSVVILE